MKMHTARMEPRFMWFKALKWKTIEEMKSASAGFRAQVLEIKGALK